MAAVFANPGRVTFETEHEARHLPVVTERAADQPALHTKSFLRKVLPEGINVIAAAERAAASDADVEAGPVVDDNRWRRLDRQISSESCRRTENQSGDCAEYDVLSHVSPSKSKSLSPVCCRNGSAGRLNSSCTRTSPLEPPLDAGGDAGKNGSGEAMRLRNQAARGAEGVVAVGGDAAAAGTKVEMGSRLVDGRRDGGVPGQVRAELVLIGRGDHVRRVYWIDNGQTAGGAAVDRSAGDRNVGERRIVLSRIAVRLEGVGP